MISNSEVQQGWNIAVQLVGAEYAAQMGSDYIDAVELAIKQLEDSVNNHNYRNLGIDQLQGYMFEEWSAGTFNVDAVASGSNDHATVLHSTVKDSADIILDSGSKYSAKSYSTAEKSAKEQARINTETGKASYLDQERLFTEDQLNSGREEAHRQALRNKPIRENVSEAYEEVTRRATDRLANEEGVESKPISRKELNDLASESKRREFKASNHGVSVENSVNVDYMLKQAMKAGFTAAAVTVAIQLAPEIYKAIDYLIKQGEIDLTQVQRIGEKGLSASAEGFLRGYVSSIIVLACQSGKMGEQLKDVKPTIVGVMVALVLQTVKNSIMVAQGKMTAQQMGAAFTDTVLVSGGFLGGSYLGGIIAQAVGFEFPVISYLLGSLIGTSISVLYNIGKKKMISFCADTGFTCFGLVEQDYEIPTDVLNEMGVETIMIPRTEVKKANVERISINSVCVDGLNLETINITVLRRGVLGVNKIGYVK